LSIITRNARYYTGELIINAHMVKGKSYQYHYATPPSGQVRKAEAREVLSLGYVKGGEAGKYDLN